MLSDMIEKMLLDMLTEEGGSLELKRNDLAERIGCVPSQINYVITSRFTPERGYIIESRRGGGGYVRITRKVMSGNEYLMHYFFSAGDEIDGKTAQIFVLDLAEKGLITEREASLIITLLTVIPDDALRAEALKKTVLTLMKTN